MMTMQTNEFAGRGSTTYDGPQDEASYFRWLVGRYGRERVRRFLPASIVQFPDRPNVEYVVMGYFGDGGLHLVDMADYHRGYEHAVDHCQDCCKHEVEELALVGSLNDPARVAQLLEYTN